MDKFYSQEEIDEIILKARKATSILALLVIEEQNLKGYSKLTNEFVDLKQLLLAVEWRKDFDYEVDDFQELVLRLYSKINAYLPNTISVNSKYYSIYDSSLNINIELNGYKNFIELDDVLFDTYTSRLDYVLVVGVNGITAVPRGDITGDYYTKTQIDDILLGNTVKAGYNKVQWDSAYAQINNGNFWSVASAQTGITGNKSGTFQLTTTNSITAGTGFIKTGYDNTYALLAGGGQVLLSSISPTNYWTTDTIQTGITGNKTTTGNFTINHLINGVALTVKNAGTTTNEAPLRVDNTSTHSSTTFIQEWLNSNVSKVKLNTNGLFITAATGGYAVTGGTSSQVLLADGTLGILPATNFWTTDSNQIGLTGDKTTTGSLTIAYASDNYGISVTSPGTTNPTLIVDNTAGSGAGQIQVWKHQGTNKSWVLKSGNIHAPAHVTVGGNNTQVVLGDGTLGTLTSGTVTSVAALTLGTTGTDLSSTVANGTTTPVITLNVPTASALNRGALSSTDWSTFNNKQGTISLTTTGTSGTATLIANTLNIPNYSTDLSGHVPYTGATGSVTLGAHNLTATNLTASTKVSVGSPAGTTGALNTGQDGVYSYRDANRYVRFNTSGTFNDFLSFGAKLVMNFGFSGTVQNISMFEGSSAGNGIFYVGSNTATDARVNIKGKSATSADFVIKAFNSSDIELFSVRNDGVTRIATTNTLYVGGNLGVGASPVSDVNILAGTIVNSATSSIFESRGSFGSSVTTGYSFRSSPVTVASSFTMTNIIHYGVTNISLGGSSAVTNQYGVYVNDLTSATNNYGIYSSVSSGSNKYNLYMAGTAENYLGGALTGTSATFTNATSRTLILNNNSSGAYLGLQTSGVDEFYIGKSNAIGGGSGFYDSYIISGGLRYYTNAILRYTINASGKNTWSSSITSDYIGELANTNTSAGTSFGLFIKAGTNASDLALNVNNAANTVSLFQVKGDGAINAISATFSGGVIHNATSWHSTDGFRKTTASADLPFVNSAGTVEARINGSGYFKASNDGTYVSSTGSYHELRTNFAGQNILFASNTSATNAKGIAVSLTGATFNNNTTTLYEGYDGGNQRFIVYTDGGIANFSANNVNLSDKRVKKDISTMGSQWEIFKNIDFVKYKYKNQTHNDYNYGVIAQQLLKVAPHFVNQDGWGNTNMLSVYDSDIHYSAHKALQEALIRVEYLEKRVHYLESNLN